MRANVSVRNSGAWIIHSSIFIGMIAVALTLASCIILADNIFAARPHLLAFVFFSSILVYNLNALSFPGETDAALKPKEQWKQRNIPLIKTTLVVIAGILLWTLPSFSLTSAFFLLHLALLAFLYVLPMNIRGRNFSIRAFPLVKIFVLCYVWSAVTVLLPSIELGLKDTRDTFLLFAERFLFILALSIPFDVRDYAEDKKAGVLTIPILLGVCRSLYLSKAVLICFVTFSFIFSGLSYISLARLICAMLSFVLINQIRLHKKEYFYLVGLDGIMILYFILLLCLKVSFP